MQKRDLLKIVIHTILMGMTLFIGIYGCVPVEPEASYPEPPAPTVLDEPGEFAVKTLDSQFENDYGIYPVTIYFPNTPSGRYPAVAFSPGLGAWKGLYVWVGSHLASHGYTVLIFTVPRPFTLDFTEPKPLTLKTDQHQAGFVTAFELLEVENQNPESPLCGRIDLSKRAIMGHSLGGVASLLAAENMEVGAVVALVPAWGIEEDRQINVTEPTQIQTDTLDRIVGDELPQSYYKNVIADSKQIININGGNHIQFNDNGKIPGGNGFSTVDTVDYVQRLSRRYFTAWLDYYLKGAGAVEPYLFGEYAEQDLQSEVLSVLEFVKP